MNEDSELARLNAELTQFEDELLRQEEEKEVRYPDGKTAVQAMKEMINTRAAAWIKEDGEGHNGAVLNEEDESKRFWAELARREQEIEARYQERKRAEEMKVTAGVKKGKRLDESKMSTLEEDEKKEDQDKMEEEKDEEEWHNDESEKVESFEAEMEWFEARRPRAPKMR
ncbi:MAG: hypothetical protein M1830_003198 [Pleopsidium flavum]|nr:MAG: hypothetical protein M1830_003198 [Pleopsidium flavum]